MLSDLQALEERLRATAQAQRRTAPQTSERLATIVEELSSSNVPARISRTISDLERGRADQSVLGEGLVTEALQNAAGDLNEAAKLASQEAERQAQNASPDALLNEIGQLRSALQAAQNDRNRGQQGQQGQQGGQQQGQQLGGQRNSQSSQNGNGSQSGNSSQQANGQSGGQQGGAQSASSAGSDGGGGARYGGAWNGGGWNGGWNGTWNGRPISEADYQRYSTEIRQQLNAIQNRIAAGSITRSDLEALRSIVPRVRYLGRNPLTGRDDLTLSVNNLELAALNAVEKSRLQTASRAGANSTSAADNETVAEYYRRLGK